jgi:hypothetical protein
VKAIVADIDNGYLFSMKELRDFVQRAAMYRNVARDQTDTSNDDTDAPLFEQRFERDGRAVDGSNGNYLDLGVRTRFPMSRTLDLLVTTDARRHSGLAINQGLATARSMSAGVTLGLVVQAGRYSIQPYVRGRSGFAQPRALNASSIPFSGASTGLVLLTRF